MGGQGWLVDPHEGFGDVEAVDLEHVPRDVGERIGEGEVCDLRGNAPEADVLEDVVVVPIGVEERDVAEVREGMRDGGEPKGWPDADGAFVVDTGPVGFLVHFEVEGAAGLCCDAVELGREKVAGLFR